jgi:hypothetical protein
MSRPALEYLFRAPPPSGAAAPGPHPPPRISRHTTPAPFVPVGKRASFVPLVMAFAMGAVVLGLVALVVFIRSSAPVPAPPEAPAASLFPPAPPIPASIAASIAAPIAPPPVASSASVAPAQSAKKPRK